jgi:hypothetical protein
MAPPRAGTAWAYLSWSALIVKLSRLPEKSGDEPFVRGTVRVCWYPTDLVTAMSLDFFEQVLARPRLVDRLGP